MQIKNSETLSSKQEGNYPYMTVSNKNPLQRFLSEISNRRLPRHVTADNPLFNISIHTNSRYSCHDKCPNSSGGDGRSVDARVGRKRKRAVGTTNGASCTRTGV